MDCKKCGQPLELEQELCPVCGEAAEKEVSISQEQEELLTACEEPQEELPVEVEDSVTALPEEKTVPGKRQTVKAVVFAVLGVVLLLALAFIVISGSEGGWEALFPTETTEATVPTGTIPADGNPDDETCKGSYTTTDDILIANRDTVVATLGNRKLTNSQLQVYYWMQVYSYAQNSTINGPNFGMALDQQVQDEKTGLSWQQYFLKEAIEEWKLYATMCQAAEKAGFKMPAEQQEKLDGMYEAFKKEQVDSGKFESVDDVFYTDMGVGSGYAAYESYIADQYLASAYYNHLAENTEVTMEDMEAFFEEREEHLKQLDITKETGKRIDVRHILLVPEGKEGLGSEVVYDDAAWEACRQKAQNLLDQWKAGDADEDSFAKLATEHSEDPGSVKNGGLYDLVAQGEMVAEFDAWCFDESRQPGDTGLVKTDYGYHIMYYVYGAPTWIRYCEINAPYWLVDKEIAKQTEALEQEISYENMGLWYWIVSKGQ